MLTTGIRVTELRWWAQGRAAYLVFPQTGVTLRPIDLTNRISFLPDYALTRLRL